MKTVEEIIKIAQQAEKHAEQHSKALEDYNNCKKSETHETELLAENVAIGTGVGVLTSIAATTAVTVVPIIGPMIGRAMAPHTIKVGAGGGAIAGALYTQYEIDKHNKECDALKEIAKQEPAPLASVPTPQPIKNKEADKPAPLPSPAPEPKVEPAPAAVPTPVPTQPRPNVHKAAQADFMQKIFSQNQTPMAPVFNPMPPASNSTNLPGFNAYRNNVSYVLKPTQDPIMKQAQRYSSFGFNF